MYSAVKNKDTVTVHYTLKYPYKGIFYLCNNSLTIYLAKYNTRESQ